jgi:hypothetical protein
LAVIRFQQEGAIEIPKIRISTHRDGKCTVSAGFKTRNIGSEASTPPFFEIKLGFAMPVPTEVVAFALMSEPYAPCTQSQARFARCAAKIEIIQMKIKAFVKTHFSLVQAVFLCGQKHAIQQLASGGHFAKVTGFTIRPITVGDLAG